MRQTYIQILLWCPDGLPESLGYDIPKDLEEFLDFINLYSNKKGYKIEAKIISIEEIVTNLKTNFKSLRQRIGKKWGN